MNIMEKPGMPLLVDSCSVSGGDSSSDTVKLSPNEPIFTSTVPDLSGVIVKVSVLLSPSTKIMLRVSDTTPLMYSSTARASVLLNSLG
jgi:hypothetical protein